MSSNSKQAAYCVVCEKAVSGHMEALECDRCRRWTHRLCGTGVPQKQYREWMRIMILGIAYTLTAAVQGTLATQYIIAISQ